MRKIDVQKILDKHDVNPDNANLNAAIMEIVETVIERCAYHADAKGIDYGGGIEDVEVDKKSILKVKKKQVCKHFITQ